MAASGEHKAGRGGGFTAVKLQALHDPELGSSSPAAGRAPAAVTTTVLPLDDFRRSDLALRLLVLSASVAALALTVSSNQTKMIGYPVLASPIILEAKFTYSSAIIYSVVATSVVCLYIILSAASVLLLPKLASPFSNRLPLLLTFSDAVMAAVLASATGGVSSIAYIARKGNSHIGWGKVCYVFDKFCAHGAVAVALCLVATSALLVLVLTSACSLYRRAENGVRSKPTTGSPTQSSYLK